MSGICGICHPSRAGLAAQLEPMLAGLAVSGDSERATSGDVSTAFGVVSRWSFQQVGAVPGVCVAVDGDLLDVPSLKSLLGESAPGGAQVSPAECLAWLYLRKGMKFLECLQGAFSLALWDEKNRRLILAIDRLGIKSLSWRKEGDRLLFASRTGAVRAAQGQAAEVDPDAVIQFLVLSSVPAPLSIYRQTQKLRPGSWLAYENGQVREGTYWDLEYAEREPGTTDHWAGEVREGMRTAVHRHLDGCAGQKTGAYLSGGTDSSSIVAFMNERISPVRTFSIHFREDRYSEIGFARTTADCFRTQHHEKRLVPEDAFQVLPQLAAYYDEPFANSSAVGAYYCARLARENGVETLFAGDGGDELFAGNERYASDKYFALYHALPGWMRRGVIEPTARLLPQNGSRLSAPARYVRRARIPNPRRILSYNLFLSMAPEDVFEPDLLARVPSATWLRIVEDHYGSAHAVSELNRLLYLDVKITLADNDLRKVVGTAEMAGVNVRFPLLDHRLAELSARIPPALKLKGFEKRFIFKQAMKNLLPHEVLYKKKHGFGVPVGQWFAQDPRLNALVRDLLHDSRTLQRGYFRPEFLQKLLDWHRGEHAGYYGEVLWYLVILELWHREHLERQPWSIHAS